MQELATYGMTPYPGVELTDVYRLLESGYRMEKPKGCPDAVYSLMQRCWQWNADNRPPFCELHSTLRALSESGGFDDAVARELERAAVAAAATAGTDSANYVLELISSSRSQSQTPNTPLPSATAPSFATHPARPAPQPQPQVQMRQSSASPSTQQMPPSLSTFSPSSTNPLLLQQLQHRQMSFQPAPISAGQQPLATRSMTPRSELASPGSRRSFFAAGMGLAHQHQHQQQLQMAEVRAVAGREAHASGAASAAGARQRPRHKTSEIAVPSSSSGNSGSGGANSGSTGSSLTSGLGGSGSVSSAVGFALQARSFSLENVLDAVVHPSRPSQFTSVDIDGLLYSYILRLLLYMFSILLLRCNFI